MVFKILNGLVNIDINTLYEFSNINQTRGHKMKLRVPKACRTDIRKYTFSQRTVLPWNNLPGHITCSTSVEQFKREYDKHMLNILQH